MRQPFMFKYKPKTIDAFEMDSKLINLLNLFIETDNLNIILLGNSGSGKTSLINCIIRKYYNLQENEHLDENNILIINSLKEQGISYYRNEVRTFCQTMCFIPKKKKNHSYR